MAETQAAECEHSTVDSIGFQDRVDGDPVLLVTCRKCGCTFTIVTWMAKMLGLLQKDARASFSIHRFSSGNDLLTGRNWKDATPSN